MLCIVHQSRTANSCKTIQKKRNKKKNNTNPIEKFITIIIFLVNVKESVYSN